MSANLDPLGIGVDGEIEDASAVGGSENGAPHGDVSIKDLLQQEFKELTETESVYIPIAGYDKVRLTAKYRLPSKGSELDRIGRNIEREFRGESAYVKNLFIALDMMIYLCDGLYVQPLGQAEPSPLSMYGDEVVNFTNCSDVFNFDGNLTTREVVRKIFGGAQHDMAILMHSEKLNRWLGNTKADLTQEFWQVSGEV